MATDETILRVSEADRAKIQALQGMINVAESEIARTVAAYFDKKDGRVVHDHQPHDSTRKPLPATQAAKKLIAVVDFGDGYGCYYDPPGICEAC